MELISFSDNFFSSFPMFCWKLICDFCFVWKNLTLVVWELFQKLIFWAFSFKKAFLKSLTESVGELLKKNWLRIYSFTMSKLIRNWFWVHCFWHFFLFQLFVFLELQTFLSFNFFLNFFINFRIDRIHKYFSSLKFFSDNSSNFLTWMSF